MRSQRKFLCRVCKKGFRSPKSVEQHKCSGIHSEYYIKHLAECNARIAVVKEMLRDVRSAIRQNQERIKELKSKINTKTSQTR